MRSCACPHTLIARSRPRSTVTAAILTSSHGCCNRGHALSSHACKIIRAGSTFARVYHGNPSSPFGFHPPVCRVSTMVLASFAQAASNSMAARRTKAGFGEGANPRPCNGLESKEARTLRSQRPCRRQAGSFCPACERKEVSLSLLAAALGQCEDSMCRVAHPRSSPKKTACEMQDLAPFNTVTRDGFGKPCSWTVKNQELQKWELFNIKLCESDEEGCI